MKIQKAKLSEVKLNPNNPRLIKDDKFKKLVQSIKDFPEMLNIRTKFNKCFRKSKCVLWIKINKQTIVLYIFKSSVVGVYSSNYFKWISIQPFFKRTV